jgi:hypothetical protein
MNTAPAMLISPLIMMERTMHLNTPQEIERAIDALTPQEIEELLDQCHPQPIARPGTYNSSKRLI